MTVVVCDASPLIFLAKLDRLGLVRDFFGERIVVLQCVADEVLAACASTAEANRLRAFLERAEIIDFASAETTPRALSRCDHSTLTWASQHNADWLVADERLLRRIAAAEGIRVVGFLGLLVEAARRGTHSPQQARAAIDEAIALHGCRISVTLYQRLIAELDRLGT